MPILSVVEQFADQTVLTQAQLSNAFTSIEEFVNNIGLDAQNIQASAITSTELAADAVTADKILDATITLDKLATEIANRLTPAGTIIASGSIAVPQGYLYCNGAAVSRTVFQSLFNAISTAYGYGDNATTFNIPDFRGQFLRGQNDGVGNDPDASARTAAVAGGNTGDNIGSNQGNNFLSHNHGGGVHSHGVTDPGHDHADNDVVGLLGGGGSTFAGGGAAGIAQIDVSPNTTGISIQNSSALISANGGNETRPINIYVRYYIKT